MPWTIEEHNYACFIVVKNRNSQTFAYVYFEDEPGPSSISEDAWRQVQGKVAANFVDAGEQSLKNIARPVRVYRLDLVASHVRGEPEATPPPTCPEPVA